MKYKFQLIQKKDFLLVKKKTTNSEFKFKILGSS
jgi:hypothetical protein